jgi:succinate dehydrogenase / fumarate reductase cytochrome b subunit
VPKLPLTSVATKVIVAVTGLALVGFVLIHMLGNLQIFMGQETLNDYAHFLKSVPEILWAARIGLLSVFVVHVTLAVLLRMRARQSRSTPYVYEQKLATTRAAQYMLVSGLCILAFVIYHLAHFTLGLTQTVPQLDPETGQMVSASVLNLRDSRGYHDVYSMVILGFQQPAIAVTYILAQLLLAMHLYHGVNSAFQTLGLNNDRLNAAIAWIGPALAIVVAIGNLSIPIAILAGVIQLP